MNTVPAPQDELVADAPGTGRRGAADELSALFLASGGATTLRRIVLAVLAAVLGTAVLHYLSNGWVYRVSYVAVPTLLVVLLLLWRGRMRAACVVFLWLDFAVIAYAALPVAGLQSPALVLLPVFVMLTGWLLGARQGWAMLIAAAIFLVVLAWVQVQGWLPPPEARGPYFWAAVFIAAAAMALIFGLAMVRGFAGQYRKSASLAEALRAANAQLEEKVAARTAELSATLERLQRTQEDLIQSEKLASLGSLVAGIAHELNTPIGNAVTVVSTLAERVHALESDFNAGTLKKSDLQRGFGGLSDMTTLIERSVNRAAALIASFKQVAVDQVSERRRVFDLRDVVEENLAALGPGLRQQPWRIVNAVPAGIECDSFPGPLGQVLANLVQNAVLHGFAGRTEGTVRIEATSDGPSIELSVADDGIGMDTVTRMRIFEPFFTTRLGQGGSGLGMAVCFRIVTTLLAGEIHVVSTSGCGTSVVVRMPRRTPGAL